jgi:hypothetical protein
MITLSAFHSNCSITCKCSLRTPFFISENEDKKLWDPSSLSQDSVEDYLAKSEESLQPTGVTSLPLGAHIRDDEQVSKDYFVFLRIIQLTPDERFLV